MATRQWSQIFHQSVDLLPPTWALNFPWKNKSFGNCLAMFTRGRSEIFTFNASKTHHFPMHIAKWDNNSAVFLGPICNGIQQVTLTDQPCALPNLQSNVKVRSKRGEIFG